MSSLSIGVLIALFLFTAGLSFVKALSGLGAAGQLIPIYIWLGLSINEAKAYGLLAITTSLSSATVDNFLSDRVDLKLGLPIIAASVCFAPAGANLSLLIPDMAMKVLFTAFLIYTGINAFRPRKRIPGHDLAGDQEPRFLTLLGIGAVAGLFSGLLGVGGGGVIAPLMLSMGYEAKKIAVVTALSAPLAALTGFASYAFSGHAHWPLVLVIGIAAAVGGYAGNRTMHGFLPERAVKYLLGVMSLLFAVKMISDLLESS